MTVEVSPRNDSGCNEVDRGGTDERTGLDRKTRYDLELDNEKKSPPLSHLSPFPERGFTTTTPKKRKRFLRDGPGFEV